MKIFNTSTKITKTLQKYTPEILTGIGIAGFILTTASAVKATPKAIKLINEKEVEQDTNSLSIIDIVKVTWKCYIPTIISGTLSILCIIGANSVNTKKNAALVTAYTLSETALRDYKNKVKEIVGEEKAQTIKESIIKDKINNIPINENDIIITKNNDTLCYDLFSGRYFKSDVNKLNKIVNDLNRQILKDGYVMLNDFYYEIGLDSTKIGGTLGWSDEYTLIELEFSSGLAADKTPCLAIDFINEPRII